MLASDASYDGRFITGVLSTGIYCLPSCRARKPKPENVRFFKTIEDAQLAGLRSCKKCKPDEFYSGEDSAVEIVEALACKVRAIPWDFDGVPSLAEALDRSQSTVHEIFREHFHKTPAEFLVNARLEWACRQLLDSDKDIGEIALDAGFGTLSAFYENFRSSAGMSPAAYRNLRTGGPFVVSLPDPYPLARVLRYIGRDPHSLSERLEGNRARVATMINGEPCLIRLDFEGDAVKVDANGSGPDIHRIVVRLLGLDQDVRSFESLVTRLGYERLIDGRHGLRLAQTPCIFDGVVWAVVGQQVNLPFTFALRRRLVERTGTPVGEGMVAPPTAEQVAQLSVEDLLPHQYSHRKAEYLIGIANQVVSGELALDEMREWSAVRVKKTLLAVRGLGPWATNYIMMRSLGFADCLPIGDTGLTAGVRKLFALDQKPGTPEVECLMREFAPHRSLACYHLWQSLSHSE